MLYEVITSRFLLHDVLREEMGFKGLVMTDWRTIPNMVKIGVAENDTIAAQLAMNAGVDMDMSAEVYVKLIPAMVNAGMITEEQVDNAVRQVLKLKQKAGLLDNPYAYFDEKREKEQILSKENLAATKEIALKSMVLLKNENQTLPISIV